MHKFGSRWFPVSGFRFQVNQPETGNRKPEPTSTSRSGLTLVEVLLATVILAVGLTALVTATSRCLAVAGKAKEYETARRLVGQVDLEIPIEFEELEDRVDEGRFSGEFADYTWRREIVEFEDEELEMFTVTTSVMWSRKGSQAKEEVTTYLYGPTYVRGEADATR